jgi:hypothetical protein
LKLRPTKSTRLTLALVSNEENDARLGLVDRTEELQILVVDRLVGEETRDALCHGGTSVEQQLLVALGQRIALFHQFDHAGVGRGFSAPRLVAVVPDVDGVVEFVVAVATLHPGKQLSSGLA